MDHHSLLLFFQSSKMLAMVVMAALINWVEMRWRVTGDTGAVVKLGQCQTLQPWLSLFLSANTFFHTLTPFLSSSTHSFSISPSFMHPLSPLHFPMSQLCSVPLCFLVMTRKQTLNNYRYIKNQCQCHDRRETYRGRSSFETSY